MEKITILEHDVRTHYRFLEHKNPTEVIVFESEKYPKGKTFWVKSEDEFVEQVRNLNEDGLDVYVGNRDRIDKNNEGVVSSNNVWVEIDEHDVDKPEQLDKLKEFANQNDIILNLGCSGGGYHAYMFHPTLDLTVPEAKEKYKQGLLNVREVLLKSGIDVDKAVFDLQRVTRVLGTYNWKRQKQSKIISFPRLGQQDRINNFEKLHELSEKYGLVKETKQIDDSAVEILDRYKIQEKDKWLYDIISKGIAIKKDTGGNSIFFKNAAIVLVRENLNDEEMRIVGKAFADLCEDRTLSAFYGWIQKAKNNELAEVCRPEINNAILTNGYDISTYEYLDKVDEKIKKSEPLELMTVLDCKKHKPEKGHLIKGLKYPGENEMLVAPSRHFKSLKSLYEAVCIASGKDYLGEFKTKKSPVLFVPAETNVDWLHTNLPKIMKGLGIRSNKIPIYFLTRDKCEDLLDVGFMAKLCKTIEDKKIKLIYFDTINPVTPSIDDNNARDVTKLFNEFLKPVTDRYKVNITYLHHTDKKGENYLGSMKWFANSDQVYRIDRKELHNRITIHNEKNRRGEVPTLEVEVNFTDTEIKFKLLAKSDASVYNKKRKMSQQEFFILKLNQLGVPKDATRKEIQVIFEENGIKFSEPTLDRALKTWREE